MIMQSEQFMNHEFQLDWVIYWSNIKQTCNKRCNKGKSKNPWCIFGIFSMLQLIHMFALLNDSQNTAISGAWMFASIFTFFSKIYEKFRYWCKLHKTWKMKQKFMPLIKLYFRGFVVTLTQNHRIIPIWTSLKYYFYYYFFISCINNIECKIW